MHVAQLILFSRQKKGLSQAKLAQRVGCHGQFISNIERAKCSVPIPLAKKICKELGIVSGKMRNAITFDYHIWINEEWRK